MTSPLHFGSIVKIAYGPLNPTTLTPDEAKQVALAWQAKYMATRPQPPQDADKPPKPPGPLEQTAIRMDENNLYLANGEHALLLNSLPVMVNNRNIKFDVIA